MSMFDYVNYADNCPRCGHKVQGFQSKDGDRQGVLVQPSEVKNFYSDCRGCDLWIEFDKEPGQDDWERTARTEPWLQPIPQFTATFSTEEIEGKALPTANESTKGTSIDISGVNEISSEDLTEKWFNEGQESTKDGG